MNITLYKTKTIRQRHMAIPIVFIAAAGASHACAQSIEVDIIVTVPTQTNATGGCTGTPSGVMADGYPPGANGIHQGIPTGGFTALRSTFPSPQWYAAAYNVIALSSTIFNFTYSNGIAFKPVPKYCTLKYTLALTNLQADQGFDLGSGGTSPIPYDSSTCSASGDGTKCTITIPGPPPDWSKLADPTDTFLNQASLYTQADEALALSQRIYQESLDTDFKARHRKKRK